MAGRLFITGDVHGQPERLSGKQFPLGKELDKDDYLIICGDFGLIWDWEGENSHERHWLKWLDERPWTTLFIDGNHENFDRLETYPIEEWHGGKVQKIRPSVIHLCRGEVFDICGRRILAMGGNYSHDIQDGILDPNDFPKEFDNFKDYWRWFDKHNPMGMYRIKGRSWWEQEVPSIIERNNALCNLSTYCNNKVDIIVSHALPAFDIFIIDRYFAVPNEYEYWLEDLLKKIDYQNLFSGHYHEDKAVNFKDICVYQKIIEV